jgi:hypothetical protein
MQLKKLIQFGIYLIFYSNIFSQQIKVISSGIETDSSFYHVTKISDNEFWAGGEYGIIKKIDSLGNVSGIDFKIGKEAVLKIERTKNYVFIMTDNAIIYRYDLENKILLKKEFSNFKNKCFYDFIVLKNEKILVCGGTSGISKGEKKIPRGFIALLNQDLTEITKVWKCYRKFAWSLLQIENGDILAATFNGINTKILKSEDCNHWKKDKKIKGLVHEIAIIDSNVWYAGARSIKFNKNGIIGLENQNKIQINGTGCLWSMDTLFDKIVTVTANGKVLIIDKITLQSKQIETTTPYAIYDIVKISDTKLLFVGHAKSMFIIDFSMKI